MKIGASYPMRELSCSPANVRRFIEALEELGFTHMMANDHVVVTPHDRRDPPLNGPYTDKDSFNDPFVLFAFAAAVTGKIDFVTGVLCLPQRQTALVAQQAANLDLLSSQRLRLGVGIGWNYVEFEALGIDYKTRVKRTEEQIELLRRFWAEPVVDFSGRFHRVHRGGINPRPQRQIPIWLGGYTEPGFVRGAKYGDGFVFAASGENAVAGWERVRLHLQDCGRDEAGYGGELLAIFAPDPQSAADDLHRFRDVGGTHGCFHSMDKGLGDDVEAHIDYIAKCKYLWDRG